VGLNVGIGVEEEVGGKRDKDGEAEGDESGEED